MIEAGGPMPISAYMNHCLHDPKDGYYAKGAGLGRDFITAPETSQIFGELIGLWALHEWQAMGAPSLFSLVEMGPGRGTLMADALRAAQGVDSPNFWSSLFLELIEASPALREIQLRKLDEYGPKFKDGLHHINIGSTLIFGNEFLDCLPARQFVRNGAAWHERLVGLNDAGEHVFGLGGQIPLPGDIKSDATCTELQPGLETLIDQLNERKDSGDTFRALFIDYGPDDETPSDTLRAYKQGEQVHPLAFPGLSDLTVDVDFGRLKRLSEAASLQVHGPITQGAFLMALGAEARMQALIEAQPEKAETIYAGAVKLIDPAEMGARFKVICISSPGLPTPAGFGED